MAKVGSAYAALPTNAYSHDSLQEPTIIVRHARLSWYFFGGIALVNALVLLAVAKWLSLQNDCLAVCDTMDNSAPFMSGIDRAYHSETFNNFDFNLTGYTARAIDVGDEVEKNWADLGIYSAPIVVPMDQVPQYDPDHSHILLYPELNPAAPYAGMTAKVQVLHYLHCVNFLRQGLWYNVDYYRSSGHPMWDSSQDVPTGPLNLPLVELHTAHCVDQLRQLVMCNVDLGIVPFLETNDGAHSVVLDFSRKKQCRNFDSFLAWYRERAWEAARVGEDKDIAGHDVPRTSWSGRDL